LASDLKAALNAIAVSERERLPPTLAVTIKFGLKLEGEDSQRAPIARENQILGDGQITTLLTTIRDFDDEEGWDGDLYRLFIVLAATGARFSQIARVTVGDVQRDKRRILVPTSRKGQGAKIAHTPVPVGLDVLDALLPAITGRRDDAPLLERWRYKQKAGGIEWHKDNRGPWQASSEASRDWREIRVRAKLAPNIIPYSLRQSSIVRAIRANLPIRLVAALHDTSVAMIERHYARWIASGLDDLAATAVVALLPAGKSNVVNFADRGT
jgi:integrase